jgi:hypothetical protein
MIPNPAERVDIELVNDRVGRIAEAARSTVRRGRDHPGFGTILLPSGHHFERFSRWARRAHFL